MDKEKRGLLKKVCSGVKELNDYYAGRRITKEDYTIARIAAQLRFCIYDVLEKTRKEER